MSWPDARHAFGSSEIHDQLIQQGFHECQAAQAVSVTGNKSLEDALAYLKLYKQPVGQDRASFLSIDKRKRHKCHLYDETQKVISSLKEYSGDYYDSAGRCDPDQICVWDARQPQNTRRISDIANELVKNEPSLTRQLCILYDAVRSRIKYALSQTQYNVNNYWASAAETWHTKTGDCKCQALLFAALCESVGFLTRIVCIPDHTFAEVLVDPSWFRSAEVKAWVAEHPSTAYGGSRAFGTGCNYWYGAGRYWIIADMTKTNYLGARASHYVPMGPSRFSFPQQWWQEKGGVSVTYRYACDDGTKFEWGCSSIINGPLANSFGASSNGTGSIEIAAEAPRLAATLQQVQLESRPTFTLQPGLMQLTVTTCQQQ